ncbi:hypothetical protein O0I10_012498 [Lichtheimia ornata]|uniref:Uncharacterized protein n=1 Tax=Lichtheimia ornata TaxID=688661 RepID=A0AAD7UQX8_9FUNG|nr:uncharacterized protein O0I10_012498 [Lichtheimia ornata]KAJ8651927.1 hypothetical protein O0I10_012498 [Lichtheimia ornata]
MQSTMESRKRKATDTPTTTTTTRRVIKRPATTSRTPTVATTRATAVRAAAIRSQNNITTTTTTKRKRPATTTTTHPQRATANGDTKSKNNNAAGQQPKPRPHWDIRGRIRDMEERLQQDQEKIAELEKYRDGLMSTVEDKESEIQEYTRRLGEADAELKTLEKKHKQEIEDTQARCNARIQELEDKQQHRRRQIANAEMDLEDVKRKMDDAQRNANKALEEHQALKKTIDEATDTYKHVEGQLINLKLKVTKADSLVLERNQRIERLTKELEQETKKADELESKYQDEQRLLQQLSDTIAHYESSAEQERSKKKTSS